MSTEVVIVAGARTPFTRFDGPLRDVSVPELGAAAVRAALSRASLTGDDVDELTMGVNFPGGDRSIARQIQLRSDIPEESNSFTVDRACCSSMTAISLGRRGLLLDEVSTFVGGGAENLGRVPFFLDTRWGHRLGDLAVIDQLVIKCPHTHVPRAVQAGAEALSYGIDRRQQDEWALRSHQCYGAAREKGIFADEVVPVRLSTIHGAEVEAAADEGYRSNATLEKLSTLPTVYGSETVTAGNAPGLSSGAAALVMMTDRVAEQRGLRPIARILSMTRASGPAQNVASIPAVAAQKALSLADRRLADISLIEINEAFAAVPLVTTLKLAGLDTKKADELRSRTNVNGGAVAIGHPTGASAARLLLTCALELQRRGGGLGLVAICGGIGEAEAAVIQVD